MKGLIQEFQQAGKAGREFRPVPFWAWNDLLDPHEIRHQVHLMREAGFGGHFMHARRGLVTSYMGKDWMECIVAACDESRETGVLPWLYDEDCWPSGTAGRRVTGGRPETQAKTLLHETVRPMNFRPTANTVAVFIGHKDPSGACTRFQRVADLQAARALRLTPAEVMIHFYYEANEYVDVLNRAATGMFLEATHEEYRRLVGRYFGNVVPGIFTDEPQLRNAPPGAAWSLELPEFFRRSNGYELADHLPALFFPAPGGQKVRFDYHQTLLRLFLLAWTLPVYQWCDRNRLALTGHFMGEDTLLSQRTYVGAVMPHYEYMHTPGIDHLRRWIRSPVLPKQVSSVANQFGRRRVLSEMWGCAGQGVTLEQLRWIADWQFVFGVNFVCPHLVLYSMRGCRKRDYPPNLFFQQPWWPQMKLLSDTLARTLAVLTEGELVADVLVVHPVTSAWVLGPDGKDREQMQRLDDSLALLTSALAGLHCDFEFGDEMIMERHARLSKGRVVIGRRRYRAVLVPSCLNWKSSTLGLLRKFARGGGKVVLTGRPPTLLDGQPSKELDSFVKKLRCLDLQRREGRAGLKQLLKPRLAVTGQRGSGDATDVAVMWRDCGAEQAFFLVNLSAAEQRELAVRLPVSGATHLLDAATGAVSPLAGKKAGAGQILRLSLPAMGSALVVVAPGKRAVRPTPGHPRPRRRKVLARRWDYKRRDPNALVLDVARATIGEQAIDRALPVADIEKMLLAAGQDTVIEVVFEFEQAPTDQKTQRLELAVENANEFEIHLNGLRVPQREASWWLDKSLHVLDVSRLVASGKNVLKLRRPYFLRPDHRDRLLGRAPGAINHWVYPQVELAPAYLIGDFGVSFSGAEESGAAGLPGVKVQPWERVPPGRSVWLCGQARIVLETPAGSGQDLLRGGYPFFAGGLELSQTLVLDGNPSPQAVLEMPRPNAVVTQVVINGRELPPLWQEPFRLEVGRHLTKGKNEIKIRLTGSLRNLLGPHHNAAGDAYSVGPESFDGTQRIARGHLAENPDYRGDYNLVPFGLTGDVILYY